MARVPSARSTGENWLLRTVLAIVLIALVASGLFLMATAPTSQAGQAGPTVTPDVSSSATGNGESPSNPTASSAPTGTRTTAPTQKPTRAGCGFSLAGSPADDASNVAAKAVGHCTVLQVGDSIGDQVGWGIESHIPTASGLTVVRLDRPSTGLAVPSFYNWPTKLATALRAYRPQLVIICLGANDQQGVYANGATLDFGSAAWRAAYAERVRKMVDEATAAGALVLWVGLPVMQQPGYDRGAQLLNSVYQQVVAANPRARYLSTRAVLASSSGRFMTSADVNGRQRTLRGPDGIHLTEAGADVMGTYILRQVAALFHVRLQPTSPAAITG